MRDKTLFISSLKSIIICLAAVQTIQTIAQLPLFSPSVSGSVLLVEIRKP